MGKYIVIINNRFIVNGIESTSAGGAEHKILDNYDGIIGAQAFGLDELGTDCLRGFCESCETISLKELREISDKYCELWTAVSEAKDHVSACDRSLSIAKQNLSMVTAGLEKAKKEYVDATYAAKNWQEYMGIPREL